MKKIINSKKNITQSEFLNAVKDKQQAFKNDEYMLSLFEKMEKNMTNISKEDFMKIDNLPEY